jgi:protein-S-isoprenylcysteine O-methyltransferase Ste14
MTEKEKYPSYSKLSKLTLLTERYILPFLFAFYALNKSITVFRLSNEGLLALSNILTNKTDIKEITFFTFFLSEFILIFLNLLVMWGLLIRKKIYQPPQEFKDTFIPLLAIFFYLYYNFLPYIPQSLSLRLIPNSLLIYSSLAGATIALMGYIISAIATYQLRKSFAIFVEVSDMVVTGMYRYVRHPIYLGYIISGIRRYAKLS